MIDSTASRPFQSRSLGLLLCEATCLVLNTATELLVLDKDIIFGKDIGSGLLVLFFPLLLIVITSGMATPGTGKFLARGMVIHS